MLGAEAAGRRARLCVRAVRLQCGCVCAACRGLAAHTASGGSCSRETSSGRQRATAGSGRQRATPARALHLLPPTDTRVDHPSTSRTRVPIGIVASTAGQRLLASKGEGGLRGHSLRQHPRAPTALPGCSCDRRRSAWRAHRRSPPLLAPPPAACTPVWRAFSSSHVCLLNAQQQPGG